VKRNRWNPRKVLVASAGVATVNYVLAVGCDDSLGKMSTIANLMPAPGGFGGATVANLVAPPPGPLPVPGAAGQGALDAGSSPRDASAPSDASPPLDASPPSSPPDAAAARDAGGDAAPPLGAGGP